LQLVAVWHREQAAAEDAVDSKRSHTSGNWDVTARPHHAGVTQAALVASPTAHQVQSCLFGF